MSKSSATQFIIYYSKTGRSRRVAEQLGERLGVRPVEVTTSRYTWPVFGWIAAGRDGMTGASAPLEQSLDLPDDGTVIVVGPVWAGGPASPLNTVVDALKSGPQGVAVLLTCGDAKTGSGPLSKVEQRLGRALKAQLVLANGLQDTPSAAPLVNDFVDACRAEDTKT